MKTRLITLMAAAALAVSATSCKDDDDDSSSPKVSTPGYELPSSGTGFNTVNLGSTRDTGLEVDCITHPGVFKMEVTAPATGNLYELWFSSRPTASRTYKLVNGADGSLQPGQAMLYAELGYGTEAFVSGSGQVAVAVVEGKLSATFVQVPMYSLSQQTDAFASGTFSCR